jgi:hypothetical protein
MDGHTLSMQLRSSYAFGMSKYMLDEKRVINLVRLDPRHLSMEPVRHTLIPAFYMNAS